MIKVHDVKFARRWARDHWEPFKVTNLPKGKWPWSSTLKAGSCAVFLAELLNALEKNEGEMVISVQNLASGEHLERNRIVTRSRD